MKKLIISILLFSLPFALLALNYMFVTMSRDRSGDLGRVGHLFFEKGYHSNLSPVAEEKYVKDIFIDSLPDSIYILSAGDSFSNKLLSVQRWNEYTGEFLNKRIINIPPCNLNSEEIILSILSRWPDKSLPKYVIIETVERETISQLSALDFDHPKTLQNIIYIPPFGDGNSGKFIHNAVEYYQRKLGMNVHLVFSNLSKPVFTSEGRESELICYYQDTTHFSNEQVKLAATNLEHLHQLAEQRGVKLFYLICPNKANVYWPYISEKDKKKYFNILDQTATFDTLPYVYHPLPLLRQLVVNGEKDIFYCDDSHWPPKTAQVVGYEMAKFIIDHLN